jgi:hypothetical protein
VGRLEESVKISTTASQAPSSVRLTALPNFLRFFFRPEAIEEIAEAVRAGRYVSAYTQFLIVISQSVVLPLALVYFIYRGFSDIVKALMVTYQIK